MGELTIERLWPRDLDSPAYRELIGSQFGDHVWPAHRQYYRWLFEEAPTTLPGEPLTVYVARENGQLIGQRAMIVVDVAALGQRLRAAWSVDHFIRPSHQRRQVGARLLNSGMSQTRLGMSIGQTKPGYAIALKHGYLDAGAMLRFTRVLRPLRAAAKRALAKIGWGHAANSLLGNPQPSKPSSPRAVIETVTSFADRLDDGEDLRGPSPSQAGVCRTPSFMQWRYFQNPLLRYQVCRCRFEDHEAYAVWRIADESLWRRGVLVDVVHRDGVPPSLLQALIAGVEGRMRSAGAEIFQCQTSNLDLIAALGSPTFSRREAGLHLMLCVNDASLQLPTTIDHWSMSLGDCDVDTSPARGSHAPG